MKIRAGWKRYVILLVIFILLISLWVIRQQEKKKIVLEFGMFVGSNWDVANANSYTIIDHAIEKFEKDHPNVTIHYDSGIRKIDYSEWLTNRILKGNMPDIAMVLSSDFEKLVSLGRLKELNGLMETDSNFTKEKYYSVSLKAGEFQDKQYALPYETVPTLMFVNKTLLQKEGLAMPNTDWTWEELINIAQEITKDTDGDGRLDQYGMYNYGWEEAAYTNDARIFDENGKKAYFTDYKLHEAIKFVAQLNDLNQGEKVTQDDFDGGNVAFMPMRFSDYRTYKMYPYKISKYSDFQWDCTTLPAGPEGGNISNVNSLVIGIGKQTKYEQLAWEFLKLLTYEEEIQGELFNYSQGASVLKDVTNSKRTEVVLGQNAEDGDRVIDNKLLSTVLANGVVTPKFSKYNEAMALANSEVASIYEEEKNVESSMKIFQRTMNRFLKQ